MALFALRRLVLAIPLIIGITFVSFIVIQLAPGGPFDYIRGEESGQDAKLVERLNKEYGLDQPIYVQYGRWLARIAKLDFGRSFQPGAKPVLTKIGERLPITLFLNLIQMIIIVGLAIPIGVASATRQYSVFDKVTTIFVFIGFATPDFWLALLLMILFGVQLDWLPISGLRSLNYEYMSFWRQQIDFVSHLILPVTVVAFGGLAGLSRYMRQSMLEVVRQDYVQTARAKGLPEPVVIGKHALRNALLPVVTILGLSLPGLIGGSVIIESIFAIPGMGQLMVQSVFSRDYPVIMGNLVIVATLTLLANLFADLAYGLVDPRIRFSRRRGRRRQDAAEATPGGTARGAAPVLADLPPQSASLRRRGSGGRARPRRHPRSRPGALGPEPSRYEAHPRGAVGQALVRDRSDRPRRFLAAHLRLAHLPGRGLRVGGHRHPHRHHAGGSGGVPRRPRGRRDYAARRFDAGLPALLPPPGRPRLPEALDLDHHGGDRADRLDGRDAPRARGVPRLAGARVRDLVGVDRSGRAARGVQAHPAQCPRARIGRHDPRHSRSHPHGVGPVIPRPRGAAALRHLGQHPERRQGPHHVCVVAHPLSGPRHPDHRALLQPARRGDSRRARPAAAAIRDGTRAPSRPLIDNPRAGPHTQPSPGRSGGIGRRARLRGVWGNPWGFESPLRHHESLGVRCVSYSVSVRVNG